MCKALGMCRCEAGVCGGQRLDKDPLHYAGSTAWWTNILQFWQQRLDA
jgi:hypothetical protein